MLPSAYLARLNTLCERAIGLARTAAQGSDGERHARVAARGLYNAASAVMLAWEGTRTGLDARRAILSRFVVEHRLETADPLEPRDDAWEREAVALLLDPEPVTLHRAAGILVA